MSQKQPTPTTTECFACELSDGPALRNRTPLRTQPRFGVAVGLALSLAAIFTANAGDILRGGSPASSSGGHASGGANVPAAEQARLNARDAMARTSQALNAVRAMQDAARAASAGKNSLGRNLPNIPNGLVAGGLQVAPNVPKILSQPQSGEDSKLWQGASLPTQKTSGGRVIVDVKQNKQQALLTWQSFNVGKNTTLKFDQSRGGVGRNDDT